MKKIFAITVVLTSICLLVNAQPMKGRATDIEAQKIGFITQRVGITADDAKVFWPVYNEYQTELRKIQSARRTQFTAMPRGNEMNEKDVENFIEKEFERKQQILNLEKRYHERFKSILPIQKIAKLYIAEELFKAELVRRIRDFRPPNQ